MRGNSGNDTLVGGEGIDDIYGGSGSDIFKLTMGNGYDKIRDFEKGKDKILIEGFKSLRVVKKGRHSQIYNGSDDLLAVIYNEKNINQSGNYLV